MQPVASASQQAPSGAVQSPSGAGQLQAGQQEPPVESTSVTNSQQDSALQSSGGLSSQDAGRSPAAGQGQTPRPGQDWPGPDAPGPVQSQSAIGKRQAAGSTTAGQGSSSLSLGPVSTGRSTQPHSSRVQGGSPRSQVLQAESKPDPTGVAQQEEGQPGSPVDRLRQHRLALPSEHDARSAQGGAGLEGRAGVQHEAPPGHSPDNVAAAGLGESQSQQLQQAEPGHSPIMGMSALQNAVSRVPQRLYCFGHWLGTWNPACLHPSQFSTSVP